MPKLKTLSRLLAPVALMALAACQTTQPTGGSAAPATPTAPTMAEQSTAVQNTASQMEQEQVVEPLLVFLADTVPQSDWAEIQIDANNVVYMQPEAFLIRDDLASVEAGTAETGEGLLALTLNANAAQRLTALTQQNIGKRLALVVDGTLLAIPAFSEPVTEGRLIFMVGTKENAITAAQIIAGQDAM